MYKLIKKMQQIEDTDPDYAKNKTWIKLRKIQDNIILNNAKTELQKLRNKNTEMQSRIEFLENYINRR